MSNIQATDLRIGNYIHVNKSNDKQIYQVANIGGFQRIFATKEDEINYSNSLDECLKKGFVSPKWHDERLIGIYGGARDGERIIESKLKGVKLTEDLIIRLGFEWAEDNVFISDNHKIEYNCGKFHFGIFCINQFDFQIPIKFVHELQNLFFVLEKKDIYLQ